MRKGKKACMRKPVQLEMSVRSCLTLLPLFPVLNPDLSLDLNFQFFRRSGQTHYVFWRWDDQRHMNRWIQII